MARETVTGYCWPQSVEAGGVVGLHLSSSGGRPVAVEVARVGASARSCSDRSVEAGEHPTPADASSNGCGWPVAAHHRRRPGLARRATTRSSSTIDVDGRPRRDHAFFVVRPVARRADGADPARAVAPTRGTPTTTSAGGTSTPAAPPCRSSGRWPAGYLHKPPGAGRRVTTTHPPDPQMAAHVGYLRLNHLSPYAGSAGWPDWELPFVAVGRAGGLRARRRHQRRPRGPPRAARRRHGYRLLLSVGHDEYWSGPMRDTVEAFIAGGGNVAFLSGNTSFWQVRLEDRDAGGPGAVDGRLQGPVQGRPVLRHRAASASSRACGPTTSSAGPRTT